MLSLKEIQIEKDRIYEAFKSKLSPKEYSKLLDELITLFKKVESDVASASMTKWFRKGPPK